MRDHDDRLDVFDRNSEGWSAADSSEISGQSLQYVLQNEVFNFNARKETFFYRAVMDDKHIAYLRRLLDEGADQSVRCGYGKTTALLHSIHVQSHDIISLLLQTPNAPVGVGDLYGTTPLHELVTMMRFPEGFERRGPDGESRLAKGSGCVMVYVEQLLSKGANPLMKDENGDTPRDCFIQTAAGMKDEDLKDPTKAYAIINSLKMAEDGLVEDINNQRLMAVMMATQERIGADSPLSELDPDILRMIVESMGALMTPEDIGKMQTEELRAFKRIGDTRVMRV